ncbi:hypothetical protein STA1M1_20240 [Sinisalibacter aestuarii]|uniref:Twin-arginine translocation signal domain-containing protein n=1 Tax=Sinisalibacter aestuarii TaxID=2949426 RepID=A0ABQ5LT32_9RHOB|nr:hypothetical protein STA1M1_20240 [Sinisalibacter aestuarii]
MFVSDWPVFHWMAVGICPGSKAKALAALVFQDVLGGAPKGVPGTGALQNANAATRVSRRAFLNSGALGLLSAVALPLHAAESGIRIVENNPGGWLLRPEDF